MLSNGSPPMAGARRIGMGKSGSQDTPSAGSAIGDRRSAIACDRAADVCGNAEPAATEDAVHEPVGSRPGAAASRRPALTLDVARYEAMLADPALSEAERTAFLEALWEIIVVFVDLGFDIHPLQQVEALPPRERVDDPSKGWRSP
jgi:hypothetical protein